MVLDPLSALSIGASVVQFIDFSTKLISKTTGLYRGSRSPLIEIQELHDVSLRLVRLNNDLASSRNSLHAQGKPNQLPPAEEALQQVSLECSEIANEFTTTLKELLIQSEHKAWKSCRQALKVIWHKEGLEAMQRRLGQQREQLVIHLLVVVSNNQMEYQQVLLKGNRRFEARILEALQASNAELKDDIATFSAVLGRKRGDQDSDAQGLEWVRWQEAHSNEILSVFTDFSRRIDFEKEKQLSEYIMRSLYFRRMRDRELRIHPAHAQTFGWIFDTSDQRKPFSDFKQWIESHQKEGTMYWVSGKPGSGKSTLMRFLVQHHQTNTLLQAWASPKLCLIACWFFWIAGTDLQKSFDGLLRSLLYDFVKQEPSLLGKVFLSKWKAWELTGDQPSADFTRAELEDAFQQLAEVTAGSHHLALFIDGLDELKGSFQDHSKLLHFLRQISRYEHIKICVSSRPWPVFQSALSGDSLLRLEDLTHEDIKTYISDELSGNTEFQSLQLTEPDLCSALSQEIVNKAQGVFLWVFLVVRSLLQGMVEGDTTDELYVRLRQMPEDLDAFFSHIIASIEVNHRPEAVALFKIVLEVPSPTVLSISFLSEALKNAKFWHSIENQTSTPNFTRSRTTTMARRIESRSKGLLEVGNGSTYRPTVEFLHRSARDFLLTRPTQDILEEHCPLDFDPNLFMCKATLAQLKIIDRGNASLKSLGRAFLEHFHRFEASSKVTDVELMDHFLSVFEQQMLSDGWPLEPGTSTSAGSSVSLALSAKIELYATYVLNNRRFDLNAEYYHPLISRTPAHLLLTCIGNAPGMLRPTEFLLKKGARLDQAWDEFLLKAESNLVLVDKQTEPDPAWAEMARLFICHGPLVKPLGVEDMRYCAPLIRRAFPEESDNLISLLNKKLPAGLHGAFRVMLQDRTMVAPSRNVFARPASRSAGMF